MTWLAIVLMVILTACGQDPRPSRQPRREEPRRSCLQAGQEYHVFPGGRTTIATRWHCHDGRTCVVAWVSADGLDNDVSRHANACDAWGRQ